MNKRIQRAIDHIESHQNDELNIILLAEISAYSPFHFCRVFKAQMGESVMSYSTRIRLEASSIEVSLGKKQMIDVAADAGFKTPSGFLKAFKKHFGTTPTEYKRTNKQAISNFQNIVMDKAEIVSRETAYVVYTRETGDYYKSADIAWERLSNNLNKLEEKYKGLPPTAGLEFDPNSAELLGICYDDPEVTKEEKIRYEACIAWSEVEIEFLKTEQFNTKTIVSGKYAKALHKGSYETSDDCWYGLYIWIEANGFEFRNEPSFEKYLNTTDEVKSSELLTEIYVPVR